MNINNNYLIRLEQALEDNFLTMQEISDIHDLLLSPFYVYENIDKAISEHKIVSLSTDDYFGRVIGYKKMDKEGKANVLIYPKDKEGLEYYNKVKITQSYLLDIWNSVHPLNDHLTAGNDRIKLVNKRDHAIKEIRNLWHLFGKNLKQSPFKFNPTIKPTARMYFLAYYFLARAGIYESTQEDLPYINQSEIKRWHGLYRNCFEGWETSWFLDEKPKRIMHRLNWKEVYHMLDAYPEAQKLIENMNLL